jgi:serine/threonine protein kinase
MSDESTLQGRAEKRVGAVLRGKYTLDHVLGVGGMAAVYAATHRNRKRFAVKMLHPELSLHGEIRTRFLREGYAANSVEHPGAVAVLDDDTAEDGAAFLVMELLEGEGVEALWDKYDLRLPVPAVLAIGHQLLDVLASAHSKGIVHRDIPSAAAIARSRGVVTKPRTRSASAPTYTVRTVMVALSSFGYWRTLTLRTAWSPAMSRIRLTTIARTGRRTKMSVSLIGYLTGWADAARAPDAAGPRCSRRRGPRCGA